MQATQDTHPQGTPGGAASHSTRGDWLVLAVAGLGIGLLHASLWQGAVAARSIEVRVAGEVYGHYPLDRPRTIHVGGVQGESVLRIEDGRVRFVTSPCRNQVCVHSGWLSHAGDAAACLPNRVSVSLEGGSDTLDAVSF